MNYKKILASFLGIAMILPQVQEFTPNTCVTDAVSITDISSKGKELGKSAKISIGVGGVLALICAPLIPWAVYKCRENTTEKIMRWVIDSKNAGRFSEYKCHQKGLYPESVFEHVKKGSTNIAACYFGEDAIQKCMADAQRGDDAYENSTHAIGFCNGKYIMSNDPRHDVFGDVVPLEGGWVVCCDSPGERETKRFVELCGCIYKAEYDAETNQLSIKLQDGEGDKIVGYFEEDISGVLKFYVENYGRYVELPYPGQMYFIKKYLPKK